MRKAFLLIATVAIITVFLAGVLLLQNPSAEASPPEASTPHLFVIPEVPLGTIAVLLASFTAVLIKGRRF